MGLEILDMATGQRRELVARGKDPVWSPKGHTIAYVQEPTFNAYLAEEVWIIDPDGQNPRRLARGGYPRWSKDGKTVLVHSRSDSRILAVPVDQMPAEQKVFFEEARSWYPAISPDEKKIAFSSPGKLEVVERATGKMAVSRDVQGE
jgi:hypothetical protein